MNEEVYKVIGRNIKKYRKEKKYSIKEISESTGLDTDYLKKIEIEGVNGSITFDELNNISIALNINLKDLINK